MNARAIALIALSWVPSVTLAQTTTVALSPADCALLLAEYGVTSPSCAATRQEPVVQSRPVRAQPVAASNSNPLRTQVELSASVRESHVFFLVGGATLDDAAKTQLSALGKRLTEPLLDDTCLRLVGHSDRSGGRAANDVLSLKRSEAVEAYLAPLLAAGRIVEVTGRGFADPLSGLPPEAHENRRVAIYLRRCR
jgi:outer membrane protein OmpA-like peptidoglycan-associated protein